MKKIKTLLVFITLFGTLWQNRLPFEYQVKADEPASHKPLTPLTPLAVDTTKNDFLAPRAKISTTTKPQAGVLLFKGREDRNNNVKGFATSTEATSTPIVIPTVSPTPTLIITPTPRPTSLATTTPITTASSSPVIGKTTTPLIPTKPNDQVAAAIVNPYTFSTLNPTTTEILLSMAGLLALLGALFIKMSNGLRQTFALTNRKNYAK